MTLPVFETPRLTLRSITAHDAEGLHEAYGDTDAMRHWDLPPSRDVSQTAELIRVSTEADPRSHGMWAIQTHAGRFVGAINYHAHNEQQRRLAVGWIVVPSCWRQGLMRGAAPPVISHCFTRLNVHRIEARIEPENLSSRRLAGKLGFTEEGTLRDWLCVAGEFRRVVTYSLLRTEWMNARVSQSLSAPSSKGADHADRRRADSSLECGQPHQPLAPADPRLSERRCPEGDGCRRCRCRPPHAAHAMGSERERALYGGRACASRPVRDPRQLPPGQARAQIGRAHVWT